MSTLQKIPLYESNKIYTRKTQGFYQRLRRYTGIPLLLIYFVTPWISIDNHPAVLFDLSAQKFHIFWITLWPQDGMLLAWLLILSAFTLFAATVLFGRIWCGFTCPQTLWTQMFIWAEDKCEGDRNQRIKLDNARWGLDKLIRKTSKHSIWLLIAFATGFTFVAYFYGAHELLMDTLNVQLSGEAFFWLSLFTLMTYMNAGWLREQVCLHMCPYARFQSVMYDEDTLLVAYDKTRGDQGDCIDCSWCVQVCPVDIDIRDGLQYSCIDCGLCIDACDNVMDKIEKPRGLIRFSSLRVLESGVSRILRPRLVGYSLSVVLLSTIFITSLLTRDTVSLDVVRDRGAKLFVTNGNHIENIYTVRINNKSQSDKHYTIGISGNHLYDLQGNTQVKLSGGEIMQIPLRVAISRNDLNDKDHHLEFVVYQNSSATPLASQKASFIGPNS